MLALLCVTSLLFESCRTILFQNMMNTFTRNVVIKTFTQYLLAVGVVTVVGIYAALSNGLFSTDDDEDEKEDDEEGLTTSQF